MFKGIIFKGIIFSVSIFFSSLLILEKRILKDQVQNKIDLETKTFENGILKRMCYQK